MFTKVSFSQKNEGHLSIDGKVHYGFIMQHRESIGYIIKDHIPAFEINISKQTNGKNYWEQLFRYPEIGIGYSYADLGDPDIMGCSNSVYGFMNSSIIKRQNWSFNYQIASGLSYLNKIFDTKENYYNTAIGSHFNIYFNTGFNIKARLSKKLELINTIGLTHYSNGSSNKPNLGFNIVSYNLGLKYNLYDDDIDYIKNEVKELSKKNEYTIFYAAGVKEYSLFSDKKEFASSISIDYNRIINHKRKIGIGTDIFYSKAIIKLLEAKDGNTHKQSDAIQNGVHFSFSTIVGKLTTTIQLGVYTHSTYKEDGYVYNRFGFQYKLTENIFANISLKTHIAVADFIEFGVGYSL
jgi:hypothetical protein